MRLRSGELWPELWPDPPLPSSLLQREDTTKLSRSLSHTTGETKERKREIDTQSDKRRESERRGDGERERRGEEEKGRRRQGDS